MKFSVIINSRDPVKSAAIRAHYDFMLGAVSHEVIIVDDAVSMADGYNRGFAKSYGEIIIFSHDDIEFLEPESFAKTLWGKFSGPFDIADVVGLAGTDRLINWGWIMAGPTHIFGAVAHKNAAGYSVSLYGPEAIRTIGRKPIQAMDGLFLACRRDVVNKIKWDEAFGWHHYDLDWTYRCHLAGYSLEVVRSLPCVHSSGGSFDAAWQESGRKFLKKHTAIKTESGRQFGFAWQHVATKEAALALMK